MLGSHDWPSAGPQNPVAPETKLLLEAPYLGPSAAPGPSRRTLPLACLADGGSGGSGDSDPGVRGTGAQAGSDLPGRFRSRLSLSSPSQAATATSPL